VYCDPPYVPLSSTSSFTAYSGNIFQEKDQRDLASLAQDAWNKGIHVVLSNHDTELTRSLYYSATIKCFTVQRFISCNGDNRAKAPEILAVYG
jgi:DNA adenine methylase